MQLPRLTSIGVGGYKSIRGLQALELRPVTVLVGANGSGKSNLISFLKLLNAIGAGNLQEFIGLSGGSNTVLHYGVRETPAMWISLAFTGKTGEIIYFSYLKDTGKRFAYLFRRIDRFSNRLEARSKAHSARLGPQGEPSSF